MPEYEVERRVPKNLKNAFLGRGAVLKKSYSGEAYYYGDRFNSEDMLRVRDLRFTYPEAKNTSCITRKIAVGPVLQEINVRVLDGEEARIFMGMLYGSPLVVNKVKLREEFEYKGATICVDDVENLGWWTEVEVMAEREECIQPALQKVENIFAEVGTGKEELVMETYPELLLGRPAAAPV